MFDKESFLSDIAQLKSIVLAVDFCTQAEADKLKKEKSQIEARIEKVFQTLDKIQQYEQVLWRIAYDDKVSHFSSDPNNSPFHLSYLALGGSMVNGVLLDTQDSIKDKLVGYSD